jgi:molybdate transport system substrate-binding protein
MTRRTRLLAAGLTLSLAGSLAACGGGDQNGQGGTDGRTITVLAASSLTDSFSDLAHEFEKEHPGVSVKLAFDSSATLAQQALDGAPADVLATADTATMDTAADAVADGPTDFATNTMVLVVPRDNPAGIGRFSDIANQGVSFITCVQTAPCGKVAAALLDDNAITTPPVSLEVDVRSVLAKVTSDEADAGLVYATDATAAGDQVTSFDIPHAGEEITTYPIATLTQSKNPDLAKQFMDLVLGSAGQRGLADAGFSPAPTS